MKKPTQKYCYILFMLQEEKQHESEIFSPDTDVMILAVRRVPMMTIDTAFVAMG